MTVSELLPALSHLTHADKLRVMQHLATELADEHKTPFPSTEYPVWSPHTAYEAADLLLSALAADDKEARR